MADSTQNPPQPAATAPNPLLTEPELIAPDTALMPKPPAGRRAAATFIFFTVTLDMLALGMIAPVLPRLIESFLHGDTSSAAKMLGLFGTVFAGMQFFFSPILGSLSDRFGRRPVVLLSNFGLGLDYLLMAWAPALNWLFLGRVISGLTASSIPTAMAYMADVTPRERRAAAFGMLNAAFGIGFVVGPAMGGLLGNINPRLPFWVAGALSLVNGLYGLFVLPESLSLQNRSPFSWRRANPVGSLSMLNHGAMLAIAAVLLIGYIAQQSLMNVYVIYADYRYHWTDRTVGFSLATIGICSAIYGVLLVKPVVAKLGERGAITIGLIGGAIGYSLFGFSKTGLLFWLGIPFLNMMSFTWPAAQSLLSRKTSPSEQGQLQGAINSLRGIAGLLGPSLFTYIFSKSIGIDAILHLPGAPFYAAAAMLIIALLLAQRATSKRQLAH
jgi:DHA1 family tetracycline resistance protein-like MFS transporter